MVNETIFAYQEVANAIFQPPNSLLRISPLPLSRALQPAILSQQMEQCIGSIIHRHLHDRDAAFATPVEGSYTRSTAVLAGTTAYINAPPYIFHSYATSEPPSPFTVYKVARAAIAVPLTSLSFSLGSPPIEFINAGIVGNNNPAEVGLSEAKNKLHSRVACLVSLGASLQKIVQIEGPLNRLSLASEIILETCKAVHDRMCRRDLLMDKEYFWFDVSRGLEDVDIQLWKTSDTASHIAGVTEGYMRDARVDGSLDSCAQSLIGENYIYIVMCDAESEY